MVICFIKKILQQHRTALIIAVCVSILYGSHHILMRSFVVAGGGIYAPVTEAADFDEGADYAPRAKAAYNGDLLVGDIALAEYNGSPAFLPILNPLVMAVLGLVTGSFESGIIASDFIFPPLIFLLIYLIAFELTGRRTSAAVFACVFIILPKIGLLPSFASLPFFASARELYFSRFEYPSVTFPFFALASYLILRALQRPARFSVLGAGIASGLLFYTYLYDWMYVFTALGFLCVYFMAIRDHMRVRTLATIIGVSALVSVGYWINFFQLASLPSFSDIVSRLGVEVGRRFRIEIVWTTYIRALLLSGAIWLLYVRKTARQMAISGVYMVAFLLPIIVLLNLQLVTGVVPQPDHWHRTQFFILALALFAIALRLTDIFARSLSRCARLSAASLLIGTLFIYGLFLQYRVSIENFSLHRVDSEYTLGYAWLSSHTQPGSVVGSLSSATNGEILLYTRNKIFLPNGFHTVAPTAEIWNRALMLAAKHALSMEAFVRFIETNTFYLFVGAYYDHSFGSYFKNTERKISTPFFAERALAYESLLAKYSNTSIPYRLDYIIVGPREKEFVSAPHLFEEFPLVYDAGGVRIYKIKP